MVQLHSAQAFDMAKADQRPRNLLSPLHVGEQVRAAREQHGVVPFAVEDTDGFVQRARGTKFEQRQPHHLAKTFSFSAGALARRGASLIARPSPPSHGGGTRSASGQGTSGTLKRGGSASIAELAGLLVLASGDPRPAVEIRLGEYRLKVLESGALYCEDMKARVPRNTAETVQANTWYAFRIFRERLGGGREKVQVAIDDRPLASFETSSPRVGAVVAFAIRGTLLPGRTPPSVRFEHLMVRPEE
jgi:hypothetical protein